MSFGNQGNKIKQTTIDQCARVALAKGYVYFAVQNTAECWSDQDAQNRYEMLGASTKCIDGVGLKGTNMVYRFNGKNVKLYIYKLFTVLSRVFIQAGYNQFKKR